MTDPFQDVDSASPELVELVVAALEARALEDQMVPLVERYLERLDWPDGALHLEVGTGTGAIARRMAERAGGGTVLGVDPSRRLVESARRLAGDADDLRFEVGDGAALDLGDGSVENVVMHTVLSHVPEPETLLREAARVLVPGGRLAVCDADFEKSSLGNFDGDPLDACAEYFVRHFVTRPYLISELRRLVAAAGLAVEHFGVDSRTITDTDGGLAWVRMGTHRMVELGLIDARLAAALADEYVRRKEAGTLYGHQPFGTLVAVKPA